jgi:hypothetical protein
MVKMDTIKKERFRSQCPDLWSPEDCRHQTVEVKHRYQRRRAMPLARAVCGSANVIIKNVIMSNSVIYGN